MPKREGHSFFGSAMELAERLARRMYSETIKALAVSGDPMIASSCSEMEGTDLAEVLEENGIRPK